MVTELEAGNTTTNAFQFIPILLFRRFLHE